MIPNLKSFIFILLLASSNYKFYCRILIKSYINWTKYKIILKIIVLKSLCWIYNTNISMLSVMILDFE